MSLSLLSEGELEVLLRHNLEEIRIAADSPSILLSDPQWWDKRKLRIFTAIGRLERVLEEQGRRKSAASRSGAPGPSPSLST